MPPQPLSNGPPRRLMVVALLAVFAAMAMLFAPPPVDAHGNDSGAAARASATRFHVFTTAYDVKADGHCALGRLHLDGRWRTRATDCSHSPVSNGVGSQAYEATGWINASACIDRHSPGGSTCHYGGFQAPFGSVRLGNAP